MTGKAVVGPLTGTRLRWIPTDVMTWKAWRTKHPETTVLKPPGSLGRYAQTETYYKGYAKKKGTMFPLGPVEVGDQHGMKDPVTIVEHAGRAYCYPHSQLDEGTLEHGALRIHRKGIHVRITNAAGKTIPSMTAYWFAWESFYKGGTVYTRPK